MKMLKVLFSGVILTLGLIGPAWAGFTDVYPTQASGELSLIGNGGVLDILYGLGNLERIEDWPLAGEQLWQNLGGGAFGRARYANTDYDQTFGYFPGVSGGTFVPLLTLSRLNGNGLYLDLSTAPSGTFPAALDVFRAGYDTSLPNYPLWSSRQSDNADGTDHMVTWLITGGPSAGNYVVAWEAGTGLRNDVDYQDLVIEISKAAPPVPEASTLMLFGSGLSGLAFYVRKRRLI